MDDSCAIENRVKAMLEAEIAACDALENVEFLETMPHPASQLLSVPERELPPIVKKYPNLVKAVKEILEEHGVGAAERRRTDDRAHSIGISCQRVSDYLSGDQYNMDVSKSSVQRLYLSCRVNDRRAIDAGNRYGLIKTTTAKVPQ